MRIVLDTNALVSGILTPYGTCGEIVRSLTSGVLGLCVDSRILFEYEDVLLRPDFGFDRGMVMALLEYIGDSAIVYNAPPLPLTLADPDDNAFLELAAAAHADCLVTGNMKHFPMQKRQGVGVLSPAQFVEALRKAQKRL